MDETIQIPEKCRECIDTDFQLKNCPYQLAIELKDMTAHFKKEYGVDLGAMGLKTKTIMQKLKPQAAECLSNIDKRAHDVILQKEREEQQKRQDKLERQIEEIKETLQQVVQTQQKTQIFRESEVDAPVKEVKKPKKKIPKIKKKIRKKNKMNYTFHENDDDEDEDGKEILDEAAEDDEMVAHGGWKKHYRNVKKENVPKYMKKLGDIHPELEEEIDKFLNGEETDAVKVTDNSSGNKMIEYREMVPRSEIE